MSRIAVFLNELRRRNVFKVGVAYVIVAWLLMQFTEIAAPALRLPEWTLSLITYLLIIGFPLILLFAWAFEVTPEGVKYTHEVDPTESITTTTGRRFNVYIISLLLIAVIYMAMDNYVLIEEEKVPAVVQTTDLEPVEEASKAEEVAEQEALIDDRKSLAVLPFANRSRSEDDAFFVDGIHDDILTQLAKISSLKVISRTSVMQYRDTEKTIKTIGKELGVATVVEGGIQRAGNRIRMNVQLIDTETDEHLWAETFNQELSAENIFEIQEQIATKIATALRATLSTEEQERIRTVPTKNLAALEAYFHGKQHIVNRTSEGLAKAVEYFEQAVTLDPDFALAYVGLSDTYILQTSYSGFARDEMDPKAEEAINKALALDDKLGEAYASLGLLRGNKLDFVNADEAFQKALAFNPNYAAVYNWYGIMIREQDRVEEALALFRKGAELDPFSLVLTTNIAYTLSYLGKFEEARELHEKVSRMAPESAFAYTSLASYYWFYSGQLDEALRLYQKAYLSDRKNILVQSFLALLYWDMGDDKQAECWAKRAIALSPRTYISNLVMQILYLYQDNEDQAVEFALKALQSEELISYINVSRTTLKNQDMKKGDYQAARSRYEKDYPELFMEAPGIAWSNYSVAIDLATVLQATGEMDQVNKLFKQVEIYLKDKYRTGFFGYGIKDVHLHALRGEKQKALKALRQAIDGGWRKYWRYELAYHGNLDSIRDEPEFREMLEEVRSETSAQLAKFNNTVDKEFVCAY